MLKFESGIFFRSWTIIVVMLGVPLLSFLLIYSLNIPIIQISPIDTAMPQIWLFAMILPNWMYFSYNIAIRIEHGFFLKLRLMDGNVFLDIVINFFLYNLYSFVFFFLSLVLLSFKSEIVFPDTIDFIYLVFSYIFITLVFGTIGLMIGIIAKTGKIALSFAIFIYFLLSITTSIILFIPDIAIWLKDTFRLLPYNNPQSILQNWWESNLEGKTFISSLISTDNNFFLGNFLMYGVMLGYFSICLSSSLLFFRIYN